MLMLFTLMLFVENIHKTIKLIILTSLLPPTENLVIPRHRKHVHPHLRQFPNATAGALRRDAAKRGLNIGLQLQIPTTTSTEVSNNMKLLEKAILKTLGETKAGIDGNADKILEEDLEPVHLYLKPFFQCDHWDAKTRTCWLDRNIGDTVTFSLSTDVKDQRGRPDIIWKKQFSLKDTNAMKEYILDPRKHSRNIVIGRRGYELRISPVTELDLDENQFSASFARNTNTNTHQAQVNFRIRVMPEDLGFVYIGETLDLSIESHVALPLQSMSFHWYTEKEGEYWTLPSNMRVSPTGLTLRISELRQEQEGIVACSIYTNKDVHATKKRFLIRKPASKDVLNFSNPNITFHNETKIKRNMRNKKRHHQTQTKPEYQRHGKKAAAGTSRTQRQISETNIDGDRFTFVQQEHDQHPNFQTIKGYSENDRANSPLQDITEKPLEKIDMSFGNSTDMETVLNINMEKDKYRQDDTVAQLVSYCMRDIQCSNHASCIKTNLRQKGFCRCLLGFYGPGIFCREDM